MFSRKPWSAIIPSQFLAQVVGAWILLTLALAQSMPALAGRPLNIDDVAPVAAGQLEIELGFSHALTHRGGRDQRSPAIGLTYGLFEGLEFGLAIQRLNQNEPKGATVRGFEDLHLSAKYKFLNEAAAFPALAATIDVKLPTAHRAKNLSTGKADETFLLIAAKTLAPVSLHTNFGYTVVGRGTADKLRHRLRGGGALEWPLGPQWSLVGELFGASRSTRDGKNEADFQLGARYALQPALILDFAAGRSLRSTGATLQGTFGLTWTIDVLQYLQR